jgi:hypothetical protein
MDCNHARRLLDFARPGVSELDAADLIALETHLAECSACATAYRAERRSDERLAAAMQAVPISGTGSSRLMAKLAAARRAWWHTRVLSVAALLLGLTLAADIAFSTFGRPTLDPVTITQAAYEQTGQGRTLDEARTIVDQWLRGIDRTLSAPAEWNYKLVAFLERSDLQGLSSVPTFVMISGSATARVYVVRANAYRNVDALEQPVEAGGCSVGLRRYADLPGWLFVVITTGGSLDLFLRPSAPLQPA